MRSLIIFEVEHGETTDPLETLIAHVQRTPELFDDLSMIEVTNYSVKVDLPECFRLA